MVKKELRMKEGGMETTTMIANTMSIQSICPMATKD
jgi:hypothetical protein